MQTDFVCHTGAPRVETTAGPVRGYHDNGIDIFKGIPYGTAKRFHAPQPPEHSDGLFDATSFGCVCPLLFVDPPRGELKVPHRYWVQDENCLNLNIWTPACDQKARPVLVWLHGGGFSFGSAIEHVAYEGENMAKYGDCVVISINHRLNILGYFDLSEYGPQYANSANAGTDDMILALRWIKENIAAFGGDPNRITLFGQSGGGAKITTLLQTPAADGLFQAGIIMSGVIARRALESSSGSTRPCVEALMAELGLSSVQQLETVPYTHLAEAYNKVAPALKEQGVNVGGNPCPNDFYYGNPLSGGFRPETAHIPLIVGTVFSEFLGFADGASRNHAVKDAAEILGKEAAAKLGPLFSSAYPQRDAADLLKVDTVFRAPSIDYIKARAAAGGAVYSYLFEQDFPLEGGTTAWHCADIPFLFHNVELVPLYHFEGAKQLEEKMFQAVMAFASSGNPGWPASTPDTENTMLFGPSCRLVQNHDHALIEALSPLSELLAKSISGAQIQH